ncbi:MAG TPA: hypothetical protein VEU11_05395, partial [Terriglobales bacterium]|nr:hypothetical protein [Terriglobales bacterium]
SPWRAHLADSIEELYGTSRRSTTEALAGIFTRAEEAYLRHLPSLRSETISIEPLVEDHPGPPVYITRQLTAEQRAQYRDDLKTISADLRKLAPDVPDKNRVPRISSCLDNAIHDLEAL